MIDRSSDTVIRELMELLSHALLSLEEKTPALVDTILSRLDQLARDEPLCAPIIELYSLQYRADLARRQERMKDAVELFGKAISCQSPSDEAYWIDLAGLIRSLIDDEREDDAVETMAKGIIAATEESNLAGLASLLKLARFFKSPHALELTDMRKALKIVIQKHQPDQDQRLRSLVNRNVSLAIMELLRCIEP